MLALADRLKSAIRTDTRGLSRWLISLGIVAFLAVVIDENLPGDRQVIPRFAGMPAAELRNVGVEQGWGMFVWHPDPPPSSEAMRARVTLSDGTTESWSPLRDRFVGAQRAARWSKYAEFARPRSHGEGGTAGHELWLPLARWLARKYQRPGVGVVMVELIVTDQAIAPLGTNRPTEPVERVFYTLRPSDGGPS